MAEGSRREEVMSHSRKFHSAPHSNPRSYLTAPLPQCHLETSRIKLCTRACAVQRAGASSCELCEADFCDPHHILCVGGQACDSASPQMERSWLCQGWDDTGVAVWHRGTVTIWHRAAACPMLQAACDL